MYIRDAILVEIKNTYGRDIALLVKNQFGAQIAQDIYEYIDGLEIAWLLDLQTALRTVDRQMKAVDMQSTILLAERSAGRYEATVIWNGITLFEDPDCRESGGLLCDQIAFNLSEMVDSEYPLEVISSTYDAVETGDQLEMRSHEIKFNYGRLGLYLLTNLVLPDEPGNGLAIRDVVLAAINCRGMAGRLAGDNGVLGWEVGGVTVGLSLEDLVGTCQDGVFSVINDFVDQFHIPLRLNLSGSTGLADLDGDGLVDRLSGGSLGGNVEVDLLTGQSETSQGGPVEAQFTGFRVGGVDDAELGRLDPDAPDMGATEPDAASMP
jgi:hypothetical protein